MPHRRQPLFTCVSAAAAVAALAVCAPSASAAPDWTAAIDHPVPAQAVAPTTIERYGPGGVATVAFLELVSSQAPITTVLHVGTRAPGGPYVESFARASTGAVTPVDVTLAVAPSGAAVLGVVDAIGDPVTGGRQFSTQYRPAGAADFQAPTTLATDASALPGVQDMSVAIGAGGTAAAAVRHAEVDGASEPAPGQSDTRVDVAVHGPGEGGWGTPTRVSTPDESVAGYAMAVDGAGNVTAILGQRWSEGPTNGEADDRTNLIERRRSASTGVFSSAEDLTPQSLQVSTGGGVLAVNARGDAVVGYQVSGTGINDLHARTRVGASGAWSDDALVSGEAAPESAAITPGGKGYLVYDNFGQSSTESCFGAVRAQAGGGFSAARCVSRKNLSPSDGAVTTVGEDAYFSMQGSQPGNQANGAILASRWADGSALPDVSHDADSAGVGYGLDTIQDDGNGSAVMTWFTGTNRRLTAFDGGAPTVSGLAVPATATVGQEIGVSAAVSDLWSAVAGDQPAWDFGDGSPSASGPSVRHTFAAAGTYTVTARGTDARGNTRTATATIAVSAVPVSKPGDLLAPTASLTLPKGKKKLGARSSYKTLRGIVVDPAPASAIASVEVAVFRLKGKTAFSLKGKSFKKTTRKKAELAFVPAKVAGGTWSLKLPTLRAGKYVVLVRATDTAGNRSGAGRTKLTLR